MANGLSEVTTYTYDGVGNVIAVDGPEWQYNIICL